MKKSRRYSVMKKSVSKRSRLSIWMAAVSACAFLFCIIVSALSEGRGTSYIGAVGLGSALLALYGCVLGIKELSSAENSYKKSYAGAIAGGVVFIIWLAIFLTGVKG